MRNLSILMLALGALGACDLAKEQAKRELKSPTATARAHALDILARAPDEEALDLAVPLLRDTSARVRRSAVAAVGALGGADAHMEKLASRLRDGDLEVRLAAARVLGDCKRPEAKARLIPALEDPSVAVRAAAARSLGKMGLNALMRTRALADHEVKRQLGLLRVDDDQRRATAIQVLGRSGRPEVTAKLLPLLKDGGSSTLVVREAARAVARTSGAKALKPLEALARSKDPYDRSAAAGGLALISGSAAKARLMELLKDDFAEVKATALNGLRVRQSVAGVPAILAPAICPLLLDGDRRVAVEAARLVSAKKLGCPLEIKVLAAAPKEGNPGPIKLVVLGYLSGPAVDSILLISAQALYRQHLGEATRWVSARKWRELAGAAVVAAPAATNKPAAGARKKALEQLMDRFPERLPEDDLSDPLLPPRVSDSVVEVALHGLGARPAATTWLAELAREGRGKIRVAALEALAMTPAPDDLALAQELSRVVASGLSATSLHVRRAAAAACALLGKQGAPTALGLLRDPDFTIRSRAAICLGTLKHGQALPLLLQRLGKEKSLAIIRGLAALGDHRATRPLVSLLRRDHAADRHGERVALVDALGALAHPAGAAAALEQELTHPAAQVRLAAARALARSGRPRSTVPLSICAGGDYDAQVRAACAVTMKALKEAAAR